MNIFQKYESLSPIYKYGLTNHLPMMITALKQMGVEDSIIDNVADNYVKKNDIPFLLDKQYPISEFEETYISKTNLYLDQLAKDGKESTIKEFFTIANYSLSSGLFHGLIRLYYSVLENDNMLIAQALAYFELISSKIILDGSVKNDTDSFTEMIDIISKTKFTFKTPGSMSKLNELIELPELKDKLFTIRNIDRNEEILLDLFLRQYLKSENFYILHVITGFHALIELKQYFADYQETLEQFFYVAQLFMLMHDYSKTINDVTASDLVKLRARILELSDPHDIKLFFTITKLSEKFNNELLNKVATMLFNK
jgi:hypothetical protein